MFTITITDDKGKVVGKGQAEIYFFLGQTGDQFTKLFSHNDLVVQKGLVGFANQQINAEVTAMELRKPR